MKSEPTLPDAAGHSDSAPIGIDACWNRIGVRGDGSCPELSRRVHCRNCPVYAVAAKELLNGEVPPGYLADWSARREQERPATARETHAALIFRLGGETFALDVEALKEVSEVKPIHSLPHRHRSRILGLVNIRGELLVCVSLVELLHLQEPPPDGNQSPASHPYFLVSSHRSGLLVVPVDAVAGIHRFTAAEVRPVPSTIAAAGVAAFTKGILAWQGQSVGYLDGEALFRYLSERLS